MDSPGNAAPSGRATAVARAGRAVEQAYRTLREAIDSGRYPPRSRITEQEVARASGVSRTPVREALRRLQAEGLIEFRPNQGAVVAATFADDAEELLDLRALLESHGAGRAARRLDSAGIAVLRDLAERQYQEARIRAAGYLERMVALNGEFHRRLCDAAESPRLARALASILDAPLMQRTFHLYTVEDLGRSAQQHLEVVEALAAGDADWAAAAMRAHVLSARRLIAR